MLVVRIFGCKMGLLIKEVLDIVLGTLSNTTLRILSVTPFSLRKKIRKGGRGVSRQIDNLFFGPKSGFFDCFPY